MVSSEKDKDNVICKFDNSQEGEDISSIIANAFANFVCSEISKNNPMFR